MTQAAIIRYIVETFDGVYADRSTDDTFFFYDPERMFPFATIVTADNDVDNLSNLNRPSVFRLNIGIARATYQSLFAAAPADPAGRADEGGGHDFTALDRLMPHPLYGRMHWVCVLNPGTATFEALRPLLAEAYKLSVGRYGRRTTGA